MDFVFVVTDEFAFAPLLRGATANEGGGGGIRTPEGFYTLPVFKTGAINRSTTPPLNKNRPFGRDAKIKTYRDSRYYIWPLHMQPNISYILDNQLIFILLQNHEWTYVYEPGFLVTEDIISAGQQDVSVL